MRLRMEVEKENNMHNTHMCSFQGSRLFIPVNTTNFILYHKSYCIASLRHCITKFNSLEMNAFCKCRVVYSGTVTSSQPLS